MRVIVKAAGVLAVVVAARVAYDRTRVNAFARGHKAGEHVGFQAGFDRGVDAARLWPVPTPPPVTWDFPIGGVSE